MYPRMIQTHLEGGLVAQEDIPIQGGGGRGDPCLVLTSDPKPRLRWTADLHERFVDAVTQLGGASRMSASCLLESPSTGKSSPNLPTSDHDGYEVNEALRTQMEVQSKLHLQVEAEKHLQIRQDAERRYMAMLETACKMLADQFISGAVINTEGQKCQGFVNKAPRNSSLDHLGFYSLQSPRVAGVHGSEEEVPPSLHPQRADCSTESCLTSHESPGGLTLEGSPGGGQKRMLGLDSTTASLIWGEGKMKSQDINVAQVNPRSITGYGI